MGRGTHSEAGWRPLRGSYEEAVLSWHEQVEKAFAEARHHNLGPGNSEPLDGQAQDAGSVIELRADESPP